MIAEKHIISGSTKQDVSSFPSIKHVIPGSTINLRPAHIVPTNQPHRRGCIVVGPVDRHVLCRTRYRIRRPSRVGTKNDFSITRSRCCRQDRSNARVTVKRNHQRVTNAPKRVSSHNHMTHRVPVHCHAVAVTHLNRPRHCHQITLVHLHRRLVERRHARSIIRYIHHCRERLPCLLSGQHDHACRSTGLRTHQRSHTRIMVDRTNQARSHRGQRVSGLRRVDHRLTPNTHLVFLACRNRATQSHPVHLVNARTRRRQRIHAHLTICNSTGHIHRNRTRVES